MLAELASVGVTYAQVAAACNCHPNTVSYIASGRTADCGYSIGRTIESLHGVYCEQTQHFLNESAQDAVTGLDADPAVGEGATKAINSGQDHIEQHVVQAGPPS